MNKIQANPQKNQSALSKFKLGYEYDITWHEVAKDVRKRAEEK